MTRFSARFVPLLYSAPRFCNSSSERKIAVRSILMTVFQVWFERYSAWGIGKLSNCAIEVMKNMFLPIITLNTSLSKQNDAETFTVYFFIHSTVNDRKNKRCQHFIPYLGLAILMLALHWILLSFRSLQSLLWH